jgi:hypothetical protein
VNYKPSVIEVADFENLVRTHFSFVEKEHRFRFTKVWGVAERDVRDSALQARYSNDHMRFDVCWAKFDHFFGITLTFSHLKLFRRHASADFESLIEFLTNGNQKRLIPSLPRSRGLRRSIDERKARFSDGLPIVVERVAAKFHDHLGTLVALSAPQIASFHQWEQQHPLGMS